MSGIIPKPLKEITAEGKFYIDYATEIVIDHECSERDYFAATILKKAIYENTDFELTLRKAYKAPDKNAIYLFRKDMKGAQQNRDQAYELGITENLITIAGETDCAIMYGVQSLIQLFMLEGDAINCRQIEDSPILAQRGFYHDATRGRVRKLSEYKKLADTMALYKMNQLQLYVEHSFCFRDFSEVWRDDTPLTPEDITELDAYCKNLCIDLVPSIASFGHLYKVLKTKSYENLCELEGMSQDPFSFDQRMQHHTLNVIDDESYKFVEKMLDEYIPLFSSKYVNICADETFDLGKGKSREEAEKVGVNQIYVDFVNKLATYCINRGKTPMFWGDIIVGSPEYANKLRPELICLNWGYADNELENNTKVLAEKGMKQYICPGCHGWRHMINKLEMAYRNISLMCGYAIKYKAEGLLNTDWGDYGHLQDPMFSVPALIYGAAFSWAGISEEQEIDEQISRLYLGDASGKILVLIKKIALGEVVRWEEFVQYKEHSAAYEKLEDAEEIYDRISDDGLETANEQIQRDVKELLSMSAAVNATGRRMIRRIALFAKGQILIHKVMPVIGRIYYQKGQPVNKSERYELAAELEHWMYAYKNNWRQDSQESELYRIEEVFYWYADILRS